MSGLDRRLGHYRPYTTGSLRKLLEGAGFTVTALRYYNLVGFFGWLWRFRIFGRIEQSPGWCASSTASSCQWQLRVERALPLPPRASTRSRQKR